MEASNSEEEKERFRDKTKHICPIKGTIISETEASTYAETIPG